jgi:nicotinate-nucleotide adenylyltransferase
MRVALFGGSFDPPHCGHLEVARAATETFALDRVYFAPTGLQPLKPDGAGAPFGDRLAMVRLLCAADPRFVPSSLDSPCGDGQPNFAVDTLHRLRGELPENADLFSIAGADSFLTLRRWHDPERVIAAAEWIVVSRPGFSLEDLTSLGLTKDQMSRVHLLEGVSEPASATAIRQQLHERNHLDAFLTSPVLAYIRQHHLYTSENS